MKTDFLKFHFSKSNVEEAEMNKEKTTKVRGPYN